MLAYAIHKRRAGRDAGLINADAARAQSLDQAADRTLVDPEGNGQSVPTLGLATDEGDEPHSQRHTSIAIGRADAGGHLRRVRRAPRGVHLRYRSIRAIHDAHGDRTRHTAGRFGATEHHDRRPL